MSTIQVRNLPDDVTEIYRQRAQAAGQSLQAYMREQLISVARQRTKAEVMAIVEDTLARDPGPGLTETTIVESLRELRGE